MKSKLYLLIIACSAISVFVGVLIGRREGHDFSNFIGKQVFITTNASQNSFTLDFGGKPKILFKISDNSIGITMYDNTSTVAYMSFNKDVGATVNVSRLVIVEDRRQFVVYSDDGEIAERINLSDSGIDK